ncbi:tigger transposable element-derived protein 2-like isoform X4 [Lethenteron reissneri]|uniref:tigger transposable element-derived protein 2-like isoform X4 n=1 Tax=Lethenteron reissneri TaxID=7753 RepID=UPI002AB7294E|nr:tigger transposable element-derived protein 2-like isoform X4 [Lethenteron reissneri]
MEAWTPGAFLCTEPFVKQECDDNPGCEMWMEANVKQEELSDTAVRDWETRAPLIKSEHGEESTGCEFSEDDFQAEREDLQTKREQLRAYHSSLRPAVTCDPQGDHAVMGSCAEVEVELGDMNEAGSGRLACGICGRRFMNRNSLRRHMLLHEGDVGTKKHQCRLCLYATELATELHQHEKAHAVGRVHACGECGRDFVMASQLRAHLRVHAEGMRSRCDDGVKTTTLSPNPDSPVHIDLAGDGAQIDRRGIYKLLTIEQKVELIRRLRQGETVSSLVAEYGVGTSTVYDIRRMADKILGYVAGVDRLAEPAKCKRMTKATLADLDDAIFEWFRQMRACSVNIDGPALCSNALRLHEQMEVEEPFAASSDWLKDFSSRHGIQLLPPLSGPMEMDPLRVALEEAKHAGLTREQVYNAVDMGIFWKRLPSKSMVSRSAETSPDSGAAGYRVMVLLCANASGTHRLKLAVVGKAKWLRVFKGLEALPVDYNTRYSARGVEAAMLQRWFKQRFVPAIRQHLRAKKLPERAVLFLDHVHWRTQASIESDCGDIRLVWLPAGSVSPLRPMWSSAIHAFKTHYRWRLLGRMLRPPTLPDVQVERALRSWGQHSINDALVDTASAWEDVRPESLQKCFTKLWKFGELEEASGAEKTHGSEEAEEPSTVAFLERMKQLPLLCDVDKADVEKWLTHNDEVEEEMFDNPRNPSSCNEQTKHRNLIVPNEDGDSGEEHMEKDGERFGVVEAADAKSAAYAVLKYMEQCGDFNPEMCKQMQSIAELVGKRACAGQNKSP